MPRKLPNAVSSDARLCRRILAPYLEDEENLFVISSDFCHWGSRCVLTS